LGPEVTSGNAAVRRPSLPEGRGLSPGGESGADDEGSRFTRGQQTRGATGGELSHTQSHSTTERRRAEMYKRLVKAEGFGSEVAAWLQEADGRGVRGMIAMG